MRKKIILMLLLLAVLLILCKTYQCNIENPTDFKVQQYFFTHGDNFSSTRLNVISCITDYDVDRMMYKIRRYYNFVYGEADRLEIILFNSEEDFKNYNVHSQQTYYKNSPNNVFITVQKKTII